MTYPPDRRHAGIALASWLGAGLSVGLTSTCASAQTAALSQDAALWNTLRGGGHVLLIRHARAPGTFDPPGFKLGDCSTQRNLNDEGRAQAKRLGELLRTMKVPVGRAVSSQWCRCVETAQLAFGNDKVTTQDTLNSPTPLSPEQRQRHTQLVQDMIALHSKSRASFQPNLAMVTHNFNIQDITGEGVAEGEILVVKSAKAGAQNPIEVVGRISTQ